MIDQYSSLIPILQIVDEISPLQELVHQVELHVVDEEWKSSVFKKAISIKKSPVNRLNIRPQVAREDEKSYSVPMPIMEISMNGLLDQKIQLWQKQVDMWLPSKNLAPILLP